MLTVATRAGVAPTRQSTRVWAQCQSRRLAIAHLQATAAAGNNAKLLRAAQRSRLGESSNVECLAGQPISRRGCVAVILLLHAAPGTQASQANASTPSSSGQSLREYAQPKQGYAMQLPAAWSMKEKAGADVLFEDPGRKSTSVGVTVAPVRVKTTSDFGDVESVGQKLLKAEQAKESTLSVDMLSQGRRVLETGSELYDYEYELNSTRGRKRIINTVSINNSKLYILNAQLKCAELSCADDAEIIQVLRDVSRSFVVQ